MQCSRFKLHLPDPVPNSIIDIVNGKAHLNEPPEKRVKISSKHGFGILGHGDNLRHHLTAAKVEIDFIYPYSHPHGPPISYLQTHKSQQVSVLIKVLGNENRPRNQINVIALDGHPLIDAILPPSADPRALEILKVFAKISNSKGSSNAKTFAFINIIFDSRSSSRVYELQLCAKILLHDSRNLVDDLPGCKNLLDLYFPQNFQTKPHTWSPRDFYDSAFTPDRFDDSSDRIETDQFTFQLYPFQRRALRWLLHREGCSVENFNKITAQPKRFVDSFCHGFIRAIDADGKDCYVSHFLGIATTDPKLARAVDSNLRGGILAEEMGLGKTVEMIALICLHQNRQATIDEVESWTPLRHTHATLIITPPSILRQWEDELQQHSPALKVMIYAGFHHETNENSQKTIIENFTSHDVVLTTYALLAREIHYAPAPNRDLRHGKKYERRLSPINQLIWWRVVLDEAQMIESGVNNAAKVAQLIPRQNSWALSGTPVRRNAKDLLGLLTFLRYQPYNHSSKLWDFLVAYRQDIFKQIFGTIALRHTKEQIKDDLQLPPQKRVVITIPFTQIEEQHYSTMYQQMCDDCGLDADGCPIDESWDPNCSTTVEKMRTWLTRLRQTCLHPEVGSHNRRALGNSRGPLRTVKEVLEVMMEQNEVARRTEERALLLSQIRRGQILEHASQSREALGVWLGTLKDSKIVVEGCRLSLKSQLDDFGGDETQEIEPGSFTASRIGVLRQRLRLALEVEHMCTFFVANAYYQIKSDVVMTTPGSATFQHLEKIEEDTYERAKELRKEILAENHRKAEALMSIINENVKTQSFVVIPRINSNNEPTGIESRNLITKSNMLLGLLEDQTSIVDEWREKLVNLLLMPLVDKENADLNGDEYEASAKQQDEVYVYMDALRAIVADRHEALTGQNNILVDHEMKQALDQANKGEGHSPVLLKSLLFTRTKFKATDRVDSLRGIVTELRDLKTVLRSQVERGNTRATAEVSLVNLILQKLNAVSVKQTLALTSISRELELFKNTMNSRLEYYRQLQQISDSVAPYEVDFNNEALRTTLKTMQENEEKIQIRICTISSRGRYLLHLQDDAALTSSQRMCIICQQPFEVGVLTSCGHSYCVECLRLWWGTHKNCPTCKKHLSRRDFHQITYKPQELVLEEETQKTAIDGQIVSEGDSVAIYSDIRDSTLNQIKNIEINGSFGTKIDTLARHMLWIREHDPGAKSIVFSQFKDFLDVLAKAFAQFKIGFTGIDRKDGTQHFKNDPSLECFLLHAKAHSSGLNLINATHVFLCEPLINTAIELQAIARVHRIGQHQPTTVWMYLVENTVEKSIYDISVSRRMSQIGVTGALDTEDMDEPTILESKIEAANSLEIQQAPLSRLLTRGSGGGELVARDDLWDCLFHRKTAGPSNRHLRKLDQEVSLHLRGIPSEDRTSVEEAV